MNANKFTCTRCGKEFSLGEWTCADGVRHSVELKHYHISTNGLQVQYGPVKGDSVQNHVRGVITFTRGTYQTTDPEQQEFLDKYPACIPFEQWQEAHLGKEEMDAKKKREQTRMEQQNNELLARVKELEEWAAKSKNDPESGDEVPSAVSALVGTGSGKKGK